jgi:cell division protein FtsB
LRVAAPKSRGRSTARAAEVTAATTRSRYFFLGALVVSAVVLFAWFPAGSLLSQRSDLSSSQDQLAALHKQDAALAQEKKNLSSPGEIDRIAREQYQFVSPGQRAFEVLPPSGAAATGTPYAGDPGSASPVTPSATSELPPGGVTTGNSTGHAGHTTAPPSSSGSSLFGRMLHALEFWG